MVLAYKVLAGRIHSELGSTWLVAHNPSRLQLCRVERI
jgi:hypothetical protein